MAMMTAIVRSREAAIERASERASNRGKCLTSLPPCLPLPPQTTLQSDDRDRGGRSIAVANCNCRTDADADGRAEDRPTHPSLNPSLSRSSRFFTPKCDRRSCLEGEPHRGRNPTGRFGIGAGEKKNGFFASFTTDRRSKILPNIRLKSHL